VNMGGLKFWSSVEFFGEVFRVKGFEEYLKTMAGSIDSRLTRSGASRGQEVAKFTY